jgi:translocation protein SEC62
MKLEVAAEVVGSVGRRYPAWKRPLVWISRRTSHSQQRCDSTDPINLTWPSGVPFAVMAEPQIQFNVPPGAPQPTPEQIQKMRQQLQADAAKMGLTVPQFIEKVKEAQNAQIQAQKAGSSQPAGQAQQGGSSGAQAAGTQQQPIQPGPPKPEALLLAKFLKSQDLKPRTCILNDQRKEMFKGQYSVPSLGPPAHQGPVKRALRAIESDAYVKYQQKHPVLPVVKNRVDLENCFKLLPLSLLALRVTKIDPHEGHNHAPGAHKIKRTKGLWTVKIEQQQECRDELHFVWLYEGSQIRMKLYAALALAVIFAVVLFPLWPMQLRLGVWYLSMGMLGLIGLFFVMAIFRLILFGVTVMIVPPGLWLYPNLFEDVGFFDSFRPLWGWQEVKKKGRSKKKSSSASGTNGTSAPIQIPGQPPAAEATTTGAAPQMMTATPTARNLGPRVEEVFDET